MSHSQTKPSEVNQSGRNVGAMEGRLFLRDDELDHSVGLILAAEKQLARAADHAMQSAELSRGAFDLLMGMRARPGLSVGQLRRHLAMTVPTFARLLGQLDKRGLVAKKRAGRDARARLLTLSSEGEALATPIALALREALRPAFRKAGAENVAGARAVLDALMESRDD